MTVERRNTRNVLRGNGAARSFPFTFQMPAPVEASGGAIWPDLFVNILDWDLGGFARIIIDYYGEDFDYFQIRRSTSGGQWGEPVPEAIFTTTGFEFVDTSVAPQSNDDIYTCYVSVFIDGVQSPEVLAQATYWISA